MSNFSYTIQEGEHKGVTLWSGRYCAVVAITIAVVSNDKSKSYILVSKRGSGTPNYQGCWNIQCGFLENNESGEECASRETFEETGLHFNSDFYKLHSVGTIPEEDKNVVLRYIQYYHCKSNEELDDMLKHAYGYTGEEDEVDEVMWLDLQDVNQINKMEWAFNHKEIINNLVHEQD